VEHRGIVDLFPAAARNLYPHTGSGAHPHSFQWILAAITRAWSSTDRYLIVEIKNEWITASIPPYAFTAYKRTYLTASVDFQLTKVRRVSSKAARFYSEACEEILRKIRRHFVCWRLRSSIGLKLYERFCAPDDGRKSRLKHVQRLTEINKLRNVASCWLYSGTRQSVILVTQVPVLH